MRFYSILLVAGVIAGVSPAAEPVEIIRDHWGVANVFAETEEALYYGAGYAMAEDRLLQMMLIRAEAEGRLAELLGPGEEDRFIQSDKTYRLLGFDRHARALLDHLQADTRRCLEAFAVGVNAFANERPDRLSKVADLFPQKPRAWAAADCMTVFARTAYQFTRGWENEVKALRSTSGGRRHASRASPSPPPSLFAMTQSPS